jgi:hypothetical protein
MCGPHRGSFIRLQVKNGVLKMTMILATRIATISIIATIPLQMPGCTRFPMMSRCGRVPTPLITDARPVLVNSRGSSSAAARHNDVLARSS